MALLIVIYSLMFLPELQKFTIHVKLEPLDVIELDQLREPDPSDQSGERTRLMDHQHVTATIHEELVWPHMDHQYNV